METNYLKEYYENFNEDGRLGAQHGQVEFLTTVRYINEYLKKGMRIIEIGAATGRYSHYFAKTGYRVDAVELVEHNIEQFKKNTTVDEPVTIRQGNALDLSDYGDNTYDVTLLLGPMYHLYTKEDQLKALSEAIRITKKGGIVFVAYCMADATILDYVFQDGNAQKVLANKMMDPDTFELFSQPKDLFTLYRKEKIEELRNHFAVTPLHFIATDGCRNYMQNTIDNMDKETFELYLKYHFSVCERQDLIGISDHTLDVFRKE